MNIMGLDLSDDSLKGTPLRVAKMYIQESFSGLNPANKPEITLFDNKYKYKQMLIERDIQFYSCCEHHFQPFFGKAHIAYIPNGKIVGLSKLPRIVDVFARRLQVQERLTIEIRDAIQETLDPVGVAVVIEAQHLCMQMRGVSKQNSVTTTSAFSGAFMDDIKTRKEFISLIGSKLS
jgi:GTP cyclohydrolase I